MGRAQGDTAWRELPAPRRQDCNRFARDLAIASPMRVMVPCSLADAVELPLQPIAEAIRRTQTRIAYVTESENPASGDLAVALAFMEKTRCWPPGAS